MKTQKTNRVEFTIRLWPLIEKCKYCGRKHLFGQVVVNGHSQVLWCLKNSKKEK